MIGEADQGGITEHGMRIADIINIPECI